MLPQKFDMEIVEQAEAFIDERGKLHVLFDEPRRAITPKPFLVRRR